MPSEGAEPLQGAGVVVDPFDDLIDRCLEGEQAAMAELIEQFRGPVFGLCLRMVGQAEDAEDLTQETFVRALRNLHRFQRDRQFRPWVLAIAGNRCRSLLATRSRRPAWRELVEEVPDRIGGQQAQQQARVLGEELDRALAGLRDEYRQAFLLMHEQQLSYEEIAEVLKCPTGTAKTWVHRARKELVAILRERGVVGE